MSCPDGLSTHPGDAEVNRHLGLASPEARSLSLGTQVPAPVPSEGGVPCPFPTRKLRSGRSARPCGGPGTGWRVPGRVARSRAQDTRRTRAWPPRRPQGLRPRSPYPQDMVAFRAAAWDLDALRGAHGGGRSVRPGRLSAARPRAPPAPRLRVALGTWHSQPPEPGRTARREMVSRQPGPLRRRRQRPLPEAGGDGPRAGGRAAKGWRGARESGTTAPSATPGYGAPE